jgi:N,N'-diacetyllegionaminate synthase
MASQLRIDVPGCKPELDQPCFIIAEAGVNHNGSLETARRLIDAAVQAGADAVKFQTFKADRLVTSEAPKAKYQIQTADVTESQYEMLHRLELSFEAHCELMAYCQEKDILFLSSPFDEESADLLMKLEVAAFKIPSGELTNLPFLDYVARKGKPMIVSTGMAYLGEVEAAVHTIEKAGNQDLVLLHCVSNYPAEPADVALAAVAMGACVIEKHFTLDRNLPGPDHRTSLEPIELAAMVQGIRTVESALGHGRKEPVPNEAETTAVARKSLVAARDIAAGTKMTEELMAIKRPGTGMPPFMRPYLVGRTARTDIPAGTLLTLEMLA